MAERALALHQIIVAYKYVSEFTAQRLNELIVELLRRGMPELVILVDAAFRSGRKDSDNMFEDETGYLWMNDKMGRD